MLSGIFPSALIKTADGFEALMPRFLLVVLLLLAASLLPAQVVVTSSGYATWGGPAVPATVPSPPLMFTPSIYLGSEPSTAYYATGLEATLPGVALLQAVPETPPPPAVVLVGAPPPTLARNMAEQPFEFGAAQFSTYPTSSESRANLVEVSRKLKAEKPSAPAKTYTNTDIQRMQQQWQPTPAPNNAPPNGAIQNNPPK
jgi:multidrug transporter EmrE-like cation transporter